MPKQEQAQSSVEPVKKDTRIDEYATDAFTDLGYDSTNLPDSVVLFYREFKKRNDIFRPSRLSPEALVFVSLMADLSDGRFAANQAKG